MQVPASAASAGSEKMPADIVSSVGSVVVVGMKVGMNVSQSGHHEVHTPCTPCRDVPTRRTCHTGHSGVASRDLLPSFGEGGTGHSKYSTGG